MICLFLADGFEELEAVAPLDILRRAGVEVQTVGIGGRAITGSHGVEITCDITPEEIDREALAGIILPGGPGHARLAESPVVSEMLVLAARKNALLAAICAAPSILGQQGHLNGKKACCYPGYEDKLLGTQVCYAPVEIDGNVITSRGAGTAIRFGLALAEYLISPEKATQVAAQIQCP